MTAPRSDALVFFGATGDLAYEKGFPALQALIQRGRLDVPVKEGRDGSRRGNVGRPVVSAGRSEVHDKLSK